MAALILLIAWTVSQIIWSVLTPETRFAPSAPVRGAPSPAREKQTDYAAQIAASHLFGREQAAKKVAAKPVDAPETRLNLKLRGVYAEEDENEGYALISSGASPEKLYKVGDPLPGNSKLSSVYPDRIILEHAGKFETLRLPESKLTGGGQRGASSRGRGAGRLRRPVVDSRMPRRVSKRFGANSEIAKLRSEVLKNPAKLAQFVNAVPARENGRFVGFKIIAKQSHPAFKELDIRSGDVVTEVNGISIDSPQKGFQVLQNLRNAKQVNVTLKRGGQIIQLSHSLE